MRAFRLHDDTIEALEREAYGFTTPNKVIKDLADKVRDIRIFLDMIEDNDGFIIKASGRKMKPEACDIHLAISKIIYMEND